MNLLQHTVLSVLLLSDVVYCQCQVSWLAIVGGAVLAPGQPGCASGTVGVGVTCLYEDSTKTCPAPRCLSGNVWNIDEVSCHYNGCVIPDHPGTSIYIEIECTPGLVAADGDVCTLNDLPSICPRIKCTVGVWDIPSPVCYADGCVRRDVLDNGPDGTTVSDPWHVEPDGGVINSFTRGTSTCTGPVFCDSGSWMGNIICVPGSSCPLSSIITSGTVSHCTDPTPDFSDCKPRLGGRDCREVICINGDWSDQGNCDGCETISANTPTNPVAHGYECEDDEYADNTHICHPSIIGGVCQSVECDGTTGSWRLEGGGPAVTEIYCRQNQCLFNWIDFSSPITPTGGSPCFAGDIVPSGNSCTFTEGSKICDAPVCSDAPDWSISEVECHVLGSACLISDLTTSAPTATALEGHIKCARGGVVPQNYFCQSPPDPNELCPQVFCEPGGFWGSPINCEPQADYCLQDLYESVVTNPLQVLTVGTTCGRGNLIAKDTVCDVLLNGNPCTTIKCNGFNTWNKDPTALTCGGCPLMDLTNKYGAAVQAIAMNCRMGPSISDGTVCKYRHMATGHDCNEILCSGGMWAGPVVCPCDFDDLTRPTPSMSLCSGVIQKDATCFFNSPGQACTGATCEPVGMDYAWSSTAIVCQPMSCRNRDLSGGTPLPPQITPSPGCEFTGISAANAICTFTSTTPGEVCQELSCKPAPPPARWRPMPRPVVCMLNACTISALEALIAGLGMLIIDSTLGCVPGNIIPTGQGCSIMDLSVICDMSTCTNGVWSVPVGCTSQCTIADVTASGGMSIQVAGPTSSPCMMGPSVNTNEVCEFEYSSPMPSVCQTSMCDNGVWDPPTITCELGGCRSNALAVQALVLASGTLCDVAGNVISNGGVCSFVHTMGFPCKTQTCNSGIWSPINGDICIENACRFDDIVSGLAIDIGLSSPGCAASGLVETGDVCVFSQAGLTCETVTCTLGVWSTTSPTCDGCLVSALTLNGAVANCLGFVAVGSTCDFDNPPFTCTSHTCDSVGTWNNINVLCTQDPCTWTAIGAAVSNQGASVTSCQPRISRGDYFISNGTFCKVEKPGQACQTFYCEPIATITPPSTPQLCSATGCEYDLITHNVPSEPVNPSICYRGGVVANNVVCEFRLPSPKVGACRKLKCQNGVWDQAHKCEELSCSQDDLVLTGGAVLDPKPQCTTNDIVSNTRRCSYTSPNGRCFKPTCLMGTWSRLTVDCGYCEMMLLQYLRSDISSSCITDEVDNGSTCTFSRIINPNHVCTQTTCTNAVWSITNIQCINGCELSTLNTGTATTTCNALVPASQSCIFNDAGNSCRIVKCLAGNRWDPAPTDPVCEPNKCTYRDLTSKPNIPPQATFSGDCERGILTDNLGICNVTGCKTDAVCMGQIWSDPDCSGFCDIATLPPVSGTTSDPTCRPGNVVHDGGECLFVNMMSTCTSMKCNSGVWSAGPCLNSKPSATCLDTAMVPIGLATLTPCNKIINEDASMIALDPNLPQMITEPQLVMFDPSTPVGIVGEAAQTITEVCSCSAPCTSVQLIGSDVQLVLLPNEAGTIYVDCDITDNGSPPETLIVTLYTITVLPINDLPVATQLETSETYIGVPTGQQTISFLSMVMAGPSTASDEDSQVLTGTCSEMSVQMCTVSVSLSLAATTATIMYPTTGSLVFDLQPLCPVGTHTIECSVMDSDGAVSQSFFFDIIITPPTAVPTAVPTEIPTAIPTDVPTEIPTAIPTDVPTGIPTAVPTDVPTEIPTAIPTDVPTEIPTAIPTDVPTGIPTAIPTDVPTEIPTAVPTDVPTEIPTAIPTDVPTEIPTAVPLAAIPTLAPNVVLPPMLPPSTAMPPGQTAVPTAIPTAMPPGQTAVPTAIPTALPPGQTAVPTAIPTALPPGQTAVPTVIPTAIPTALPAVTPNNTQLEAVEPSPAPNTTSPATNVPAEGAASTVTRNTASGAAGAIATVGLVIGAASPGAGTSLTGLALLSRAILCPVVGPDVLDRTLNPLGIDFGDERFSAYGGAIVGSFIINIMFIGLCGIGTFILFRKVRTKGKQWTRVRSSFSVEEQQKRNYRDISTKVDRRYVMMKARFGWLVFPLCLIFGGAALGAMTALLYSDTASKVLAILCVISFLITFPAYAMSVGRKVDKYTDYVPITETNRSLLSKVCYGWFQYEVKVIAGGKVWMALHHLAFDAYKHSYRFCLLFELIGILVLAGVTSWQPRDETECRIRAITMTCLVGIATLSCLLLRPFIAPYANVLQVCYGSRSVIIILTQTHQHNTQTSIFGAETAMMIFTLINMFADVAIDWAITLTGAMASMVTWLTVCKVCGKSKRKKP